MTVRMPFHTVVHASLAICCLALIACGGNGGGDGDDSDRVALVDAASAQRLGVAAAQAAQQAVSVSTTSIPGAPFQPTSTSTSSGTLTTQSSGTVPNPCTTGSLTTSGSNPILLDFMNCAVGLTVLDGTVRFSFSDDGSSISVRYISFTATTATEIVDLSGFRYSCTGLQSANPSCNFSFGNFQSFVTGIRYTVDGIDVTGDATAGFGVSGTVGDPAFGQVDFVTTEPIFFNSCPLGVPETGKIAITGAMGSSGTIEFLSCTTFEICRTDSVGAAEVCSGPVAWSTVAAS